MDVIIIAAMAKNRVIGANNQMPWHIPSEIHHFKETTWGNPIIMGRKTHEAIGSPLRGRTNIVISRNSNFVSSGCRVVCSIEEALDLCRKLHAKKTFVIGGEQVFNLALSYTDTIILTTLKRAVVGDVYFPDISKRFSKVSSQEIVDDLEPYTIQIFRRL